MTKKTIQKTLKTKMTEWLSSIKDETLRKRVESSLLVSGGSIASLFLNEEVNDYDIYLQDRSTLIDLIRYYVVGHDFVIMDETEKDKLISKYAEDIEASYPIAVRTLKPGQVKLYFPGAKPGVKVNQDDKETKYIPKFFSPNAISLSDNVQIVIRFWGTPEQIHETFDFIHATNYFTMKTGLVTNLRALESILSRTLYYQGSQYPVTSVIRAKKFVKRKWNINAGELLKIMFQISQLDLTKPDVLEEQLIGVDIAYFDLLISALRNAPDNHAISTNYFNNLVDRIFNEDDNDITGD